MGVCFKLGGGSVQPGSNLAMIISTLAMRMAASLQRRQYSLMQKCSLDIDASRKNAMDNRIAPGPYVFPPAKGILSRRPEGLPPLRSRSNN